LRRAEDIGRVIQGQGLRGAEISQIFAGRDELHRLFAAKELFRWLFASQEYFRESGVIEARALDGGPGRFIRHHWRVIMTNRLLSIPLAALLADRRALLLGKAGLLALALTLAPTILSGHGLLGDQAFAANDVPGVDDPVGHDANDDNGVDPAGHDVNDDNGVDPANHDANDDNGDDDGTGTASANRGPSANSGPGNGGEGASGSGDGSSGGSGSGGSGDGGSGGGNSGSGHGGNSGSGGD
jgi:hypothetical protein